MKTRVNDNQSLADVAIQVSGSVESCFDIAVKNNESVTAVLRTGQELDKSEVKEDKVVDQLSVKNIIPATASKKVIDSQLSGIGYMTIEQNFTIK